MGGTIGVASELGRGSTFWITFPLESVGDERVLDTLRCEALSGQRVLFCSVHSQRRPLVEALVARSGGSVIGDADLTELGARLGEGGVDLAVVDIPLAFDDDQRQRLLGAQSHGVPLLLLLPANCRFRADELAPHTRVHAKPARIRPILQAVSEALGGCEAPDPGPRELRGHDARFAEERPLRILVAEDNPVNQRVAQRMLERLGYRADLASDGAEAVRQVRSARYDLILMDMQMPELDGLQATRVIRSEQRAESRPHIIALTANALPHDKQLCLDAGMDDYLAKPLTLDALANALARVSDARAEEVLEPA